MSAVTEAPSASLPAALEILADRYDPEVIDLPQGGARIRLSVTGRARLGRVRDRIRRHLLPRARRATSPTPC